MTDPLLEPAPASMSPRERAYNWISGVGSPTAGRPWAGSPGTRVALGREYERDLGSGKPVFIAFSGGLDSSLLLAVADATARRTGLPRPIPVTNVFANAGGADETEWQRLVLGHLDLEDQWVRVEMAAEDDLVGPHALEILREVGVCWPVGHLVNLRATCAALPRGAILHTGDGGDEALGPRRITTMAHRGSRPRLSRANLVAPARALAPRPLRRWDLHRRAAEDLANLPWIREAERTRFVSEFIEDSIREPLSHRRGTEYWGRRNAVTLAQRNMEWLARRFGVTLRFPLLSDGVTRALQRDGGLFGWPGRADMVARIAGDLLPEAVIARRTKAYFNNVYFGAGAREVVDSWNGDGLDDELVDAAALRDSWSAELPHSGTFALLQEIALLVDAQ